MAGPLRQKIRQCTIAPHSSYLTTMPDGRRVFTDRYMLWLLDQAPDSLRDALVHMPDGEYAISAGGAVKTVSTSAPAGNAIGRLLDPEPLPTEAVPSPLLFAYAGSIGRVWLSDGVAFGLNNVLDFTGYLLHPTGGPTKALKIFRGDELAGLAITVRISEEVQDVAGVLAAQRTKEAA